MAWAVIHGSLEIKRRDTTPAASEIGSIGMKYIANICVAVVGLALSASTCAVYPEDGMYWDPDNSGKGYYLDVQGDMAWLIIYAYDESTGQAEIYGAVSNIRDDGIDIGVGGVFGPPPNPEGYFPLHWMSAELVKVENGPCLTCLNVDDIATFEKVGTVQAWFPYTTQLWMSVYLDDGSAPVDIVAERYNYARDRIVGGQNQLRFHDLRGEWVFVDTSNPERRPWRFHFDERIPDTTIAVVPYESVYRDSLRGAEFRCIVESGLGDEVLNGCELWSEGEVLFSASIEDIGAKRIQAFRGQLPEIITEGQSRVPEYWRGPEPVIGLRVERPIPQD